MKSTVKDCKLSMILPWNHTSGTFWSPSQLRRQTAMRRQVLNISWPSEPNFSYRKQSERPAICNIWNNTTHANWNQTNKKLFRIQPNKPNKESQFNKWWCLISGAHCKGCFLLEQCCWSCLILKTDRDFFSMVLEWYVCGSSVLCCVTDCDHFELILNSTIGRYIYGILWIV